MDSPLSMEEIQLIESTGLPAIDRHHLRLLAHSLACFKLMAEGLSYGPLPKDEECLAWISSQPVFNNEKDISKHINFIEEAKSKLSDGDRTCELKNWLNYLNAN